MHPRVQVQRSDVIRAMTLVDADLLPLRKRQYPTDRLRHTTKASIGPDQTPEKEELSLRNRAAEEHSLGFANPLRFALFGLCKPTTSV